MNFKCKHTEWYTKPEVASTLNHPCDKCSTCIKGRQKIYDPSNCHACSFFMSKMFHDNVLQLPSIAAWRRWEETYIRLRKRKGKTTNEIFSFNWVSLWHSFLSCLYIYTYIKSAQLQQLSFLSVYGSEINMVQKGSYKRGVRTDWRRSQYGEHHHNAQPRHKHWD